MRVRFDISFRVDICLRALSRGSDKQMQETGQMSTNLGYPCVSSGPVKDYGTSKVSRAFKIRQESHYDMQAQESIF